MSGVLENSFAAVPTSVIRITGIPRFSDFGVVNRTSNFVLNAVFALERNAGL